MPQGLGRQCSVVANVPPGEEQIEKVCGELTAHASMAGGDRALAGRWRGPLPANRGSEVAMTVHGAGDSSDLCTGRGCGPG